MTREEIIDGLEIYTVGRLNKDRVHITVEELQDFIDAIKALEQQPTDAVDRVTIKEYLESFGNVKTEREHCEDAISRQAVIEITAETGALETQARVKKLPPVTPQPKMGRWIKDDNDYEYFWRCSKCSKRSDVRYKYCPNCGAEMQEVEG